MTNLNIVTKNEAANVDIPTSARVSMLIDKQEMQVRTFPIPEIGDNEILVKVEGCGICGTDVHEYKGDPFGLIPVVLGHEGTGTIVKIGNNVKKDYTGKPLAVGDRVVTGARTCGECEVCKRDPEHSNLCEHSQIHGLITDSEKQHLNGWFAEYMVINKGDVVFNVNDMDFNLRLLTEPSAVVVHAVERAKEIQNFRFNTKVLVQGCGPIGLLLLAVIRTLGVEEIIAVDADGQRLEMAKELGATHTINIKDHSGLDETIAAVESVTGGKGADFAFQCTGSKVAASNIWKFIRRGGGLCELGFFVNGGDATINPHFDICNKEIKVVGSWVYTPEDWITAFSFLKRAQQINIPVEKLITHRYSLDQMNEAMRTNINLAGIKIAYVNENF